MLVIAFCNIMDKICIKGFLLRMALIWNIRQYSTPSNQVSTLVIVYKIYLFCFIFNQFYLQIESHFTKITTKAKWTQANRTLIRWQTFPTMSAWEVTASVNHTFLCNEKNKHKNYSKNIISIIALELRVHQLNENFKGMINVSSTRRLRPKQIKNHLLNAMNMQTIQMPTKGMVKRRDQTEHTQYGKCHSSSLPVSLPIRKRTEHHSYSIGNLRHRTCVVFITNHKIYLSSKLYYHYNYCCILWVCLSGSLLQELCLFSTSFTVDFILALSFSSTIIQSI